MAKSKSSDEKLKDEELAEQEKAKANPPTSSPALKAPEPKPAANSRVVSVTESDELQKKGWHVIGMSRDDKGQRVHRIVKE